MTAKKRSTFSKVSNSKVKKFLLIKHTVANKFAFSSLSKVALLAFQTKPISKLSITLIQNCTNNAISSKGFFSESRIIAASPLGSINLLSVS